MSVTVPSVWVAMVTWNAYQDTADCLRSLAAATWPNLEIVLVHNGSSDGSDSRLAQEFPSVRHIFSPGNLGFPAGVNMGIRAALDGGADFVCLLNNDTLVEPGFLEPLVKRAATTPEARIFGGKILYDGPERIIWYAGGIIDMRLGETWHTGQNQPDGPRFDRPGFTDYVTGCLLLAPALLFKELGLFDEKFFLYCEEVDFTLRARRAGYRSYYEPRAVIRHRVSRSQGGENRPPFYYYRTRNLLELFRIHLLEQGRAGICGGRCGPSQWRKYWHLVVGRELVVLAARRWRAAPYVAAFWLGFLDYLRGRFGRCPYPWLESRPREKR